MFTIRKCLIEIPNLSAKTKAFLLMTLDLYYSNFSSVGSNLERMYQGFLLEENVTNGPQEKEKIQQSFEKLSVSKSKPPNLKLNIRKPDMGKTPPTPPPFRTGSTPSTPNVRYPKRDFSAPPARPPSSRQKNVSKSPQKTPHQNQEARSPKQPTRSVSASPQFRSYSASKKLSPQEIRNKNSHPPNSRRNEKPADRAIPQSAQNVRSPSPVSSKRDSKFNKTNDENVLRPQNSPSASAPKPKVSSQTDKVYFREENIENLTWNGESAIDCEDPESSTSPKVNPYSSSFLNFLSRPET